MTREEDFAKASAQFDGIYAQVAFSTGCEHGYQYAVEKYERLIKNQLEQDISLGYANSFIDDLRKAMEE